MASKSPDSSESTKVGIYSLPNEIWESLLERRFSDGFDEQDIESQLLVNLVGAIYEGMYRNDRSDERIQYLIENGHIEDESQFGNFLLDTVLGSEMLHKVFPGTDMSDLLIVSGVAQSNIALDWKISRKREAEKRLGLGNGGFVSLQRLIAKHIGGSNSICHVHKGSGDGSLLRELSMTSGRWQQVGVADRLYFEVEHLFRSRVRREFREHPMVQAFLRVFFTSLKRGFKAQWLDADTQKPQVAFFDLNHAYDIVSSDSFGELLDQSYSTDTGQRAVSDVFEDDSHQVMSQAFFVLMERLKGRDVERTKKNLFLHAKMLSRSRLGAEGLQLLEKKKHELLVMAKGLAQGVSREGFEHAREYFVGISSIYSDARAIVNRGDLTRCIQEEFGAVERAIREIKEEGDGGEATLSAWIADPDLQALEEAIEDVMGWSHDYPDAHGLDYDSVIAREEGYSGDDVLERDSDDDSFPMGFPTAEEDDEFPFLAQLRELVLQFQDYEGGNLAAEIVGFGNLTDISLVLHQEIRRRRDEIEAKIREDSSGADNQDEGVSVVIDDRRVASISEQMPEGVDVFSEDFSFRDFFEIIFDDEFSKDFFVAGSKRANFNQNVSIPWQPTFIGDFLNIPELLRHVDVCIMSSTKGDAQQSDARFGRDIRGCLKTLAEGGIIITDGVAQAYTDIYRFQILCALLGEENPDFQAWEIVERESRIPRAVVIQKVHKTAGYIEIDQWQRILDGDCEIQEFGEVGNYPFVEVLTRLRSRILDLAGGDRNIFREINVLISKAVERVFSGVFDRAESDVIGRDEMRSGATALSTRIRIDESDMVDSCDALDALIEDGVDALQAEVLSDVLEVLESSGKKLPPRVHGTLVAQKKGNIVTLPSIVTPDSDDGLVSNYLGEKSFQGPFNMQYKIPRVPRNGFFGNPEGLELLASEQKRFRENVAELQRTLRSWRGGNPRPIMFVDFCDCNMNQLMRERLIEFLGPTGYKRLVREVQVNLEGDGISSGDDKFLKAFCDRGGLVVSGGSYQNVIEGKGKTFKTHSAAAIQKSLQRNTRLGNLSVCYSYHGLGDLLTRRHVHRGSDACRSGMLEFGRVPVVHDGKHPIFKGLPKEITTTFTHGDHFDASLLEGKEIPDADFRLLLRSGLTGLPVGYEMEYEKGGLAIGVQPHFECSTDVPPKGKKPPDIVRFLDEFHAKHSDEGLLEGFGADRKLIARNFGLYNDQLDSIPDAGRLVLLRTGNYIIDRILKHGKK